LPPGTSTGALPYGNGTPQCHEDLPPPPVAQSCTLLYRRFSICFLPGSGSPPPAPRLVCKWRHLAARHFNRKSTDPSQPFLRL